MEFKFLYTDLEIGKLSWIFLLKKKSLFMFFVYQKYNHKGPC
jgi:hypothetical protein